MIVMVVMVVMVDWKEQTLKLVSQAEGDANLEIRN
jgi:hypothetical protein